MSKEAIQSVRIQIFEDVAGTQLFEVDLALKEKRNQWVQSLLVGGVHLFVYGGIFYDLGLPPLQRWGLAIAYAFANLWLCRKCQVFFNQLFFIHPKIVTRLQEEKIEAVQIFEQLKPSKQYWLEVSLVTLFIALIDFKLGWLILPTGSYGFVRALVIGVAKLGCLYIFAKVYRQKKTQFGHLVSDYALEQKLKKGIKS